MMCWFFLAFGVVLCFDGSDIVLACGLYAPKTSLAHFRRRTIGSPFILPEDASDDEDPYLNPIIPILVDNTCGITNTGLEVPIPEPPQLCQVQPPETTLFSC